MGAEARRAQSARDIVEFLSARTPAQYRDLVKVGIEFTPYLGATAVLNYSRGGCSSSRFSSQGVTRVLLPEFIEPGSREHNFVIVQDSTKDAQFTSAAIAFRDLSRRDRVAMVALELCKAFNKKEELADYLQKNAFLVPTQDWKKHRTGEVRFEVPQVLRDRFISETFRSGEVDLYLDNPADLMMTCSTSISKASSTSDTAKVEFRPNAPPNIKVGLEAF